MAQYSFTVFRWTGTYYNAQYNTSYTATIDDDDPDFEGASDANETISINGGAFGTTTGAPYAINVSFTDTGGNPHVETFYFFNTGGNWYFIPGPGSAFTVGATLGTYQNHTTGWSYTTVTCFVTGTLIETPHGPVRVEDLRAGDDVVLGDSSIKPLGLLLSRKLCAQQLRENPKLRPVRITAGALGNGLPKRDLLVSRQHRMLVSSKIVQRMIGTATALVAAIHLTELPGIYVDPDCAGVEYFHMLFDQHEIVFAEGAPTESLFTGAEALKSLTPEALEEIALLFPEMLSAQMVPKSAAVIPTGKQQKALIARHQKNDKPLVLAGV